MVVAIEANRGDRDQLTIGVSRIIEATLKTKYARHVNVSEHAAAKSAAKSAVISCCEHIYDRSYATI